jgi:radical SAM protein with 4Fe4S-binding SPASM domain
MEFDLYVISWNVTRKCNLFCQHCYLPAQGSEKSLEINTSQELSTEEALRVIDQIALVNPEVMLILSGGEPILRKDIFELAEYASGKGMMVVLGSNGLLINDQVASQLRQRGVSGVSISLDSTDPKIHDGIRSLEGAWEAAIKAVRICRSNGLAVQINTTVTQKNYDEISGLIEYSQTLGAKVFSPFFLICTGRGEEVTDITSEQYDKILSLIVEWQGIDDGMMIRTRCTPTFRRVLYQINPHSPLLKMDTGRCLAGLHYCRITPEGNVTPCPYMPMPVGNVKRESFKDIWTESEEFALFRNPSLKGKCRLCEFRLICGGCRARAFAYYKDSMEEDPWCAYTPKKEEAIKPDSFKFNLIAMAKPLWTEEAEERLKRVPFFVRSMVRGAVERYAMENNCKEITSMIMVEAKRKLCRGS